MTTNQERRAFQRVPETFDGRRIGVLETPVSIHDLSEGGCFVDATHEQKSGVSIQLKINLPRAGWITVGARTLYRKNPGGFAVSFTYMSEETFERLHEALEHLRNPYRDL